MTRYAELQMARSQGYDEARRLGYTAIDLAAVQGEIGRLDRAASRFATCMYNVAHWDAGNRIGYVDEFNRERCLANAIGFASI